MPLSKVTLICDVGDGQGNYLTSGTGYLSPTAVLTDSSDQLIAGTQGIPVAFHAAGPPQVPLIATDDGSVQPSGWAWTFTPPAATGIPAFSFFLPATGGSTQHLSALSPVSPVVTMQAYMPLPSGTPASGQVPDATGTGEASAWTPLFGSDAHVSTAALPRPALYGATGLRRWRAALGDSLFSQMPIVCVGDSITAGQGGDNNALVYNNLPDNANGFAGQLRNLLAAQLGSYPGEGFWFTDDSRVTQGGGVVSGNWPCVPLRHGPRMLHGNGWTLQLTVPAGITTCGIIQANETQAFNAAGSNLADVSALYSQTGSATVTNQSITALTNTGLPIETDIACQPGDVITVSSPATAQSYIVGFNMKTAYPGVLLHRIGQPGYVSGDMLGGQTSGTLLQAGSAPNQQTAERACYYWAGTTGLIIAGFGTNDQANQAGAGTPAQNNVTLALFTTWMEQFCNQAIADGWCVLIMGQPRNPNAATGTGIATQDQYFAAMKSYALSTDHVAYLDIGELWGTSTASTALGLTQPNSVHPLRRGHGDMARVLFNAIFGTAGITELVSA